MMTYSTCSGATPAFSRAPLMAMPPRSDPEKSLSEPSSRPMGVRAPATITEVGRSTVMGEASSDVIGGVPTTVVGARRSPQPSMTKGTRHTQVVCRHAPYVGTMSATPDPLFTHIDHVGIAVPDLDAAIAFYEETYGMTMLHEE